MKENILIAFMLLGFLMLVIVLVCPGVFNFSPLAADCYMLVVALSILSPLALIR